jgi:predicted RNA-binding protein YlxR (DUF448 family)
MRKVRPRLNKSTPIRKCVVTGACGPSHQLIRFVSSPEGVVFPDIGHRLDGRGAWLKASGKVMAQAVKAKSLEKALKAGALAENLPQMVETLLVERIQHLLGLGRRGGMVIGGAGKIRAADDAVAILMVATDASEREARGLASASGAEMTVRFLSGEELGKVFGRPSLAFATCLTRNHSFAASLGEELSRLQGVREE